MINYVVSDNNLAIEMRADGFKPRILCAARLVTDALDCTVFDLRELAPDDLKEVVKEARSAAFQGLSRVLVSTMDGGPISSDALVDALESLI